MKPTETEISGHFSLMLVFFYPAVIFSSYLTFTLTPTPCVIKPSMYCISNNAIYLANVR